MTASELLAAARAHAREGRIDYAVHIARCELCGYTTTWMAAAFTALQGSLAYHACDTGVWGRDSAMPLAGRRGMVTQLGHCRLTEEQFQECRQLAARARTPSP